MIDWYNLAANSLWIFACALALAALSYASWEASVYKENFRQRLSRPSIQFFLNLAGLLFCLGLAGTSQSWWEKAIWLALGLAFGMQTVLAGKSWKRV